MKPDAAICIAFTTLFAPGGAHDMLESTGNFHIDADCVLGEIASCRWNHRRFAAAMRSAAVGIADGAGARGGDSVHCGFYKELLVTSFDPGWQNSRDAHRDRHYGLMGALALVVVSAFESVCAILAVAMHRATMFAAQLSDRLPCAWD